MTTKMAETKDIKPTMEVLDFYTIFFTMARHFGVMSYTLDKDQLRVHRIKSGFYYYFPIINTCWITAVTLKQGVTFFSNMTAPDTPSKEIEICFQVIYFSGTAMIVAIGVNQIWFSKAIGNLFTALIQLDHHIDQDPTPELVKAKNLWMKIRLAQIRFIPYAFVAAFLFNFTMYYFLPRFPHFIWFMVPLEDETTDTMWSSELLRLSIGIPDILMVPVGWGFLFGMDIMLGIISSHLCYYLKVLKFKSKVMTLEDIQAYKSLCIIMKIINNALAMGVIVHKAFMSCVILFMMYGIIHGNSIVAILFYVSNVSGFIVRIVYLLLPVAKLQTKSNNLVKHMKATAPPQIHRETLPLTDFCLSAGGVYKIDNDCVFNFFNFLISYFVLMSASSA